MKCISPEWLVKFHSGYELDKDDYHDIFVLCERFGIALPASFGYNEEGKVPWAAHESRDMDNEKE